MSELYAGFIRSGRRRPHPRHWQALARLVWRCTRTVQVRRLCSGRRKGLFKKQELLRHSNYKITPIPAHKPSLLRSARRKQSLSKCFSCWASGRGQSNRPRSGFFLSNPFKPSAIKPDSDNSFRLLPSPRGFEPVLPP